MTDCLFCRIVDGTIPSKQIHSDENAIAFLDISPWQEGHALVVSRRHATDALSDDTILAEMSPAIVAVGRMLKEKLGASACNILTNAGADSGQEVFHVHVHVLPRYPESPGIGNIRTEVTSELDEVYSRIVS